MAVPISIPRVVVPTPNAFDTVTIEFPGPDVNEVFLIDRIFVSASNYINIRPSPTISGYVVNILPTVHRVTTGQDPAFDNMVARNLFLSSFPFTPRLLVQYGESLTMAFYTRQSWTPTTNFTLYARMEGVRMPYADRYG